MGLMFHQFQHYNFPSYGHKVAYCKKPKFDSNNASSRMFMNTNLVGNERGRSQTRSNDRERSNSEIKHIVFYKCNNLRHITRNF